MKTITFIICSLLTAAAVQAQIIHVPEDYNTIQEGIEAASNGDTVLVAGGTYYENINFRGKKPLLVASYFIMDSDTNHINSTVIDASQGTNMDKASVVTFASGEDTTSILCGFTIRGGTGTYVTSIDERCGGGIYIADAGARISHNKITGNILDDTQPVNGQGVRGAGIGTKALDGQSWIIIEHNRIFANTANTQYDIAAGGGIFVTYNARISDNEISYNTTHSTSGVSGCGAIYHWAIGSTNTIIIKNNKIDHNSAQTVTGAATSGAVAVESAELLFSGNEFSNNSCYTVGYGGTSGLSIIDPAIGNVVTNNVFSNNTCNFTGGAIFLYNSGSAPDPNAVVISNNYFMGNESPNGGAFSTWDIPFVLQNNVFSGNYAEERGGAVFMEKMGTYPWVHLGILINNSFSNNSSDLRGGAIYSNKAMPLIFNSVFYGDTAPDGAEIYLNHYKDTLDINSCDIDFGLIYGNIYDGGKNINEDPLFEDPELLTIQPGSPCIDAGTLYYVCRCGNAYLGPEKDILGVNRPQSGEYEIGAYEMTFVSVPEPVPSQKPVPESEASRGSSVVSYPNPTEGISHFTFRISQYQYVTLKIYDVNGREVAVVLDKNLPSGEHSVSFDASGLPAGIYLYRLTTDDCQLTTAGKLVISR
jgi:predicted outer membrane repeat protein